MVGRGFIFNRAVIWNGPTTSVNNRPVIENTASETTMSYNGAVRQPCQLMRGEQGATTHSLHFIKVTYGAEEPRLAELWAPQQPLNTRCCWRPSSAALEILYNSHWKLFREKECRCTFGGQCIWKLLVTLVILCQRKACPFLIQNKLDLSNLWISQF